MIEAHDWNLTRQFLVAGSIPAFKAFFAVHPLSSVRAIGYTWEWGQSKAAFYGVANTQKGLEQGMVECNRYRPQKLNEAEAREMVRWEAGYFPYPAGLVGPDEEFGAAWAAEASKLHALTEAMRPQDYNNEAQYAVYERRYTAFAENLVTTCCEALAEIARVGLFDGAQDLDYWVGSTDDNGDIVRARDARIRQVIAQQGT
jgi:hypothetical protein